MTGLFVKSVSGILGKSRTNPQSAQTEPAPVTVLVIQQYACPYSILLHIS
jgi:hypothetical protein